MMKNKIKMVALNDEALESVVGGEESKKIGIPIDDLISPVTDEKKNQFGDSFIELLKSPLYLVDAIFTIFR